MNPSRLAAAVLTLLALPGAVQGDGAADRPVGWRGDGTGRFPAATPPTAWGRSSLATQGLRCRASATDARDPGTPMPDGVVREWLVLNPAPTGVRVDQAFLPDEATLAPTENGKVGDSTWTKVAADTSWIDFGRLLGGERRGVGCAATNLYSEAGGKFRVNATQLGAFRITLNGKLLPAGYGRYSIDLAPGWNRVILKTAPHEGGWACSFSLHARAPADYVDSNVAWRLPLPGVTGGFYGGGTGCSAPVIVGDRLYLTSEPHDLICVNKEDGRVLWVRTSSYFDASSPEDRATPAGLEAAGLAKQLDDVNALLARGPLGPKPLEEKVKLESALSERMKQIDPVRYRKWETPDVGFSGLTPVTDGKFLYLWFASGVTACYDLDGGRRWIRLDSLPAVEHGFSSSPQLVDGKVIVYMRDVFAFDAATGALAWRIPLVGHEGANPGGAFHGTHARADVGGVPLVVMGNGTIVRASDGHVLWKHPEMGNQAISSPVVDGGRLFETSTGSMKFFIHDLPAAADEPFKPATRIVSVATTAFPHYYMPWHMASPLVHEGLAYLLNNSGVLTVVDVAEGKVVYQKMLDLDGFQTANEGPARGIGISPALGGKYLYLMGNSGTTLVLEPGRTYKQVARNRIENLASVGHWGERQERFVANPVFDGDRLYIRGEANLYAIGRAATKADRLEAGVAPSSEKPKPRLGPAPAAEPPRAEGEPSPTFGFRRDGTGLFPEADPPLAWGEARNLRWRTSVGHAHASPIVVGDRVLVLSEPGELACLNGADGAVLWKSTLREAPAGVKPNKEFARATPISDGKSVFVSLADGQVAAYGLDGKPRWTSRVEPPPLGYGPSASPILAGDALIVEGRQLTALAAASGRVLWTAASEPHYGTPAVLTLQGTRLLVTAKGTVVRASDGTVLATAIAEGLGGDQAPSPVVRGDVVYFAYKQCSAVKLSLKDGRLFTRKLWEQELPGDVISSPVIAGGKVFVVPAGFADYRVLDAATGEVLLEKELDLASNLYPSLALAGGRLYVGNDQGEMLVLEPGNAYKELGHNRLPEGSAASPVFSGPRLFLRGGEYLYCFSR
jgi:outer membrane protein assembly factor BamB